MDLPVSWLVAECDPKTLFARSTAPSPEVYYPTIQLSKYSHSSFSSVVRLGRQVGWFMFLAKGQTVESIKTEKKLLHLMQEGKVSLYWLGSCRQQV